MPKLLNEIATHRILKWQTSTSFQRPFFKCQIIPQQFLKLGEKYKHFCLKISKRIYPYLLYTCLKYTSGIAELKVMNSLEKFNILDNFKFWQLCASATLCPIKNISP